MIFEPNVTVCHMMNLIADYCDNMFSQDRIKNKDTPLKQ